MELEQLEKKLEWLDEERRKDKANIGTLENRLMQLEERLVDARKEVADLRSTMVVVTALEGKLGALEEQLDRFKTSVGVYQQNQNRQQEDIKVEFDKKLTSEISSTTGAIQDLRKGLTHLPDLKKSITELGTDLSLVKDRQGKLETLISDQKVSFEQNQQIQKINEENRKVEVKRVVDLQGEVTAYRKRMEELKAKMELTLETSRKLEARIHDMQSSEGERHQSQVNFMERFNQMQVEKERGYLDWTQKMDSVLQKSNIVEAHLKNLDDTLKMVRKAREQLDDSGQKIDRRVNEITEMHRLNEEHFRQEWNAFKADDQKRWTNYSLVMDEQQKEANRKHDKLDKRLVAQEDLTQRMGDQLANLHNEEEKRLQQLVNLAHEWLTNYERLLGKDNNLI